MADDINEQRRDELTAYLDGELDEATAAVVEQRLRDDPALRREAETLKRAWELLDFLPQPEPSTDFAARTLSMAVPIPAAAAASAPVPTAAPYAPPPSPARRRHPALMAAALAAAAVLAFLAGYGLPGPFLKPPPKPLTIDQREELMARDLRVIERLPLYQHADDMDFLEALDSPDLFGDQ
jgi:anti-sigma factor RsiW